MIDISSVEYSEDFERYGVDIGDRDDWIDCATRLRLELELLLQYIKIGASLPDYDEDKHDPIILEAEELLRSYEIPRLFTL
jgi:hypothetical protein